MFQKTSRVCEWEMVVNESVNMVCVCVCMCEHSTLCSRFPRECLSRVCVRTRTHAWCVMPSFPQVLFSTISHIFKARWMISWPEHEERRRREGGPGWEWEFLFFIPQRLIPDSSTLIFPSSPESKQAVGTVSSKAGVKEKACEPQQNNGEREYSQN